jgi:hypothetical protein
MGLRHRVQAKHDASSACPSLSPTMSFSAARRALFAGARRYSTAPAAAPKSGSNLPLILLGVGAVSAGGYWYLDTQSPPPKPKQEKSPLDPQNFKDFKLKKVIPYNHNTDHYVFELPDNEASLIPVASCLVVKSSDPEALKDKNGKPVIRPYTPVSAPDHPGELVLLIKRYEAGVMSKHIHSLKEGESLSIKGPITKFLYKGTLSLSPNFRVLLLSSPSSQRVRRSSPHWRRFRNHTPLPTTHPRPPRQS